jgi:hypothetical protein
MIVQPWTTEVDEITITPEPLAASAEFQPIKQFLTTLPALQYIAPPYLTARFPIIWQFAATQLAFARYTPAPSAS